MIRLARLISNLKCPTTGPHVHVCISQHHSGNRFIRCSVSFPNSRCRECEVHVAATKELAKDRWEATIVDVNKRDGEKARKFSSGPVPAVLPLPAMAVSGQRTQLSADYVSLSRK